MIAVKGFREGLAKGLVLGIIANHVDPGHRLQKKPLPAGDPKGQGYCDDCAEPSPALFR